MTMQPYQQGGVIEVGQTSLGPGDFVPPRVKVVQQLSQEVADKTAEAGDFYNTLTGESYGSTLKFVPLFPFMNRVFIIREGDRKIAADKLLEAAGYEQLPEGDGLMCRSLDMIQGQGDPGILCAECPLAQWQGRTVAPPCSETYNLAALTERGDVIFLGFSRSSAKVGKKINSQLRLQMGAPSGRTHPWDRLWIATTRQERNDKGIYFMPDVRSTAEATPPELGQDAAYWATKFAGVRFDLTEQEAITQESDEPTTPRPF
jgi:hypothetical protein